MKAYHIYLLRHGLTQANKDGRYLGRTDAPLSGEGERQLRELAEKYAYPQAELYYSSPLLRCTRTMELLYPGVKPEIVDGFRECDFGDFEGKTLEELKNDKAYRDWIAKKGMAAPPHGESAQAFQQRCCSAFEGIVDGMLHTGKGSAVIMAHGGTIMFILGTFGYPRQPFYEWRTGNGMGYEVVVTPSLWMNGKVMDIAARIPEDAGEDGLAGIQELLEEGKASLE